MSGVFPCVASQFSVDFTTTSTFPSLLRIHTISGTHFLLDHIVSICHNLRNAFLVVLCAAKFHQRRTHTRCACASVLVMHQLSFQTPPLYVLARTLDLSHCIWCFSAQAFQNFSVDHMIIIFCTSSRHVSFKCMLLFSGDTIVSYLGHLNPKFSSCNLTEHHGSLHDFRLTFLVIVYFHTLFIPSSPVPTTFRPCYHAVCCLLP